jgi:RimJ/RimL family protein N-acetyltransferase
MNTDRLELVTFSPDCLRALIAGYDEFARTFGRPAASGLRDFVVCDDVSPDFLARLAAATVPDPWAFFGFAVVHCSDQLVIGTCGFKGRPAPDDADIQGESAREVRRFVEIGYGIVPEYRCHGFATEAARALVAYAAADGRAKVVRAHTLPESNASTRVLTKCGFNKIGEVIDPDDGLVWRWERNIGN